MFNYKFSIQYDGTRYSGWQIQDNALTVQEVISGSIQKILQAEVKLIGSGRTDAGVHALGQVANFITDKELETSKFKYSLNAVLPDDIAIDSIDLVDEQFHSRFSAKRRSYIYLISNKKSPFYDRYSFTIFNELNIEKLNLLSSVLLGEQDFTSFCKVKTDVLNKFCEVYDARWRRQKNFYIFYIEANRFLYGMVRAVVGSIIRANKLENGTEYLKNILSQKDRASAADAVPSKGLFLYKVKY